MKNRWSANTWILTILLTILALVVVDIGRSMFAKAVQEAPPDQAHAFDPPFKVGDVAPDFTLPDKDSKQRRLADLVKGDTLLVFSCGCSNCKDVQTYMGRYLMPKMGARAPKVVSVSSNNPAAEAAWIRDTELKQTILYEAQGNSVVMDQFKGHPCPRIMGVDSQRKLTWIGKSPGALPPDISVESVGIEVAEKLGFDTKTGKSGIKVPIPKREWGSAPTPEAPGGNAPGGAAPGGSAPGGPAPGGSAPGAAASGGHEGHGH